MQYMITTINRVIGVINTKFCIVSCVCVCIYDTYFDFDCECNFGPKVLEKKTIYMKISKMTHSCGSICLHTS